MIELTKMFALPKFESLRGSILASLNIGEILAILKPLASSVLKLRVALSLVYWVYPACWRYRTYTKNIGSSATKT